MKNSHGLNREIPQNIKYQIRKEAYFGCVHCGLSIYQYEHINPEYKDAKLHDPKKMTILCPTEHYKVTHHYTSKETVWKWKNEPWSKFHGHCHDKINLDTNSLEIWIGATKVVGYKKIISIDDECILSVLPPEEKGGVFRLSAIFHDNNDKPILEIKDNEWIAFSDMFDIVTSEGKIGIRNNGEFALKLFIFPPNKLVIEEINMLYKGLEIKADSKSFNIKSPSSGVGHFEQSVTFTSIDETVALFKVYTNRPGLTIGKGSISTFEKRPQKNAIAYKCRRNDDCPCGSKKKYKNCCFPRYDYIL